MSDMSDIDSWMRWRAQQPLGCAVMENVVTISCEQASSMDGIEPVAEVPLSAAA